MVVAANVNIQEPKGAAVMSKRSRARTDTRKEKTPTADCLASQKKHIRHAAVESWIHTVSCCALTALFAVSWLFRLGISPFLYAITALLALLTVGYGIRALHISKLSRLLAKIPYASEERVSFRCRKVRCLERNISRWNSILFCIIFYAEDGRRFYYVYGYPEGLAPEAAKILRQRLNGADVTLTCYKGTTVIKQFDP